MRRSRLGTNDTILHEFRTDFSQDYEKYVRMDAESFDLIRMVGKPIISKHELQDTHQKTTAVSKTIRRKCHEY